MYARTGVGRTVDGVTRSRDHRRHAGLAVAVGLATSACTGGEGPAESFDAGTTAPTSAAAAGRLPPAEFAAVVADEDVVAINVHVPDGGSLPGTEAAIPYDRIADRIGELPADRNAPLAVYCLTGRMSAVAVQTLRELGYTDVTELSGGMEAWRADGRELLPPAG